MLTVVILAAGKGTRMKSPEIPKVCHKVGNKTMIEHVVSTSSQLNPTNICVVVSKDNREKITQILQDYKDLFFVEQGNITGTGSAVLAAESIYRGGDILVLLGDVPLLKSSTLMKIRKTNYCTILKFIDKDVTNKFGRIVCNNNFVDKIVEYAEATEEERKISQVNSGILFLKREYTDLLHVISNKNSKKEYYLTDIVQILKNRSIPVFYIEGDKRECMGVNTVTDLQYINNL